MVPQLVRWDQHLLVHLLQVSSKVWESFAQEKGHYKIVNPKKRKGKEKERTVSYKRTLPVYIYTAIAHTILVETAESYK